MLLASLSTLFRAGVLLAVLGSVLLGAGDVLAIVIDPSGFSLARHDRFYQPSGQNDPPKDFIGAGIGMSGIARFQSRPELCPLGNHDLRPLFHNRWPYGSVG